MASPSGHPPFPVPLVCPACGAALIQDAACACAARTRLELWNGVPRTLFGQKYWGECSSEKMAEILSAMDSMPWKRALDKIVPNENVQQHLTSTTGPEFAYGMPWDEIETVLDVGSGMGFMTEVLARQGKTVVSLEAVPERALFQSKRAAQDGRPNWHPIIASATALPFPPASFDLITLNGVFEYIGLWGEGDPQALQQRFLENALRLLKPNGYLYVGIETRFGLRSFLGAKDHSGLPFTNLMPRRLADWYCRRRAVHFYGSEHLADGYRTYTYAPNQYKDMFLRAGFGSAEVYGVFDGYNRQRAVYALDEARLRRATRAVADRASSWKGRLIRRFANAALWRGVLEDEVVVFGRKTAKDGRLSWSGLPHDGRITQFSTSDKVFVLCFEDEPEYVFKGAKTAEAVPILEKEHAFLQEASKRHGAAVDSWALRWPKTLGSSKVQGRMLFKYEFARGIPLSSLLLPVSFDLERFRRLHARFVESYVELCARMTAARPGPAPANAWEKFLDGLAAARIDDADFAEKVKAACARLRGAGWPMGMTHGDLSLGNTTLLPDGTMVLVDWENAGFEGAAAVDLMRLLHDVWDESRQLKPETRRAVMESARSDVRAALGRMGVRPEQYADLEILFVAHQFQQWIWKEHDMALPPKAVHLLRQHRDRAFSLTA